MKRVMALGALLVALAGCGGESETPESKPEPSSAAKPTPDSQLACEMVFDGGDDSIFSRIPDALASVGAQATEDQIREIRGIQATLEGAAGKAEAELAAAITNLNVPFTQFMEVVDQGGGDITLDTSSVLVDSTAVMQACTEAGYSVAP